MKGEKNVYSTVIAKFKKSELEEAKKEQKSKKKQVCIDPDSVIGREIKYQTALLHEILDVVRERVRKPADEVVEGINNDLHKGGITEERTIFYLCDGRNPHCTKQDCYKNGGYCKHTKDITHAMNFRCEKNGHKDDYIEDQPMILQGMLDELRRITQYIHEYQNGNAERVIEMKIHINGEFNKSTKEDMKKIMLDAVKREC